MSAGNIMRTDYSSQCRRAGCFIGDYIEDESTPMEGVIFSMYQITDGITAPDGQSLKFMPDFEDCGYKTDVKTAKS